MASPFVELEVGERIVKVTNPDKVLFPKARKTKRDLVEYYIAVGDGIVRTLYERPTQLRRFPDGIDGEAIYQKRVPEKRPEWVEAARVTFPSGRHADELCVTELAQVVWAANLAVVDFHPWPSRRSDTEHPDELRIDIDPQPGTTFKDAKRVAALVKEVLDEIGYVGWPKTSGNRGIHVFCRIEPNWEFPVVRRAALAFAREIERRLPRKVTTAWWKEERGRASLHRLQPERPRPHDRVGVLGACAEGRDRVGAGHVGRASGRRDRGLHDDDDAEAVREARRHPGRDGRERVRPARAARVGRARREGGRGRGAVPAELPEDAGRAAARAALSRAQERLTRRVELVRLDLSDEAVATRLLEVQRQAYAIEAGLIGSRDIPPLNETLDELRNCGETFLGAFVDGRLVGAVSWRLVGDTLDIHRLVVDPEHFRRGVGVTLVRAALAAEPGVTRAIVQTGADNGPALALYRREGFEQTGAEEVVPGLRVARLSKRLR